jgi:hypothetical protein
MLKGVERQELTMSWAEAEVWRFVMREVRDGGKLRWLRTVASQEWEMWL